MSICSDAQGSIFSRDGIKKSINYNVIFSIWVSWVSTQWAVAQLQRTLHGLLDGIREGTRLTQDPDDGRPIWHSSATPPLRRANRLMLSEAHRGLRKRRRVANWAPHHPRCRIASPSFGPAGPGRTVSPILQKSASQSSQLEYDYFSIRDIGPYVDMQQIMNLG